MEPDFNVFVTMVRGLKDLLLPACPLERPSNGLSVCHMFFEGKVGGIVFMCDQLSHSEF